MERRVIVHGRSEASAGRDGARRLGVGESDVGVTVLRRGRSLKDGSALVKCAVATEVARQQAGESAGKGEADAGDLVESMLKLMNVDADIEVERKGLREEVRIETSSDSDGDRLIGRRGEALESLQYLLGLMLGYARTDREVRIDVDEYWEDREEELVQLAEELAEGVRYSGKKEKSPTLLPSERKVVHRVVAEFAGVSTVSEGEGLWKRVVISAD